MSINYKFTLFDLANKRLVIGDPIVSSISASIRSVYIGIVDDNGNRYLTPDTFKVRYYSKGTSFGGSFTTTGIVASATYELTCPAPTIISGTLISMIKAEAYNATANTTSAFRINIKVYKNTTQIASTSSPSYVPNSTSPVVYEIILGLHIPSTSFNAGNLFKIVVEIEITALASDDTLTVNISENARDDEQPTFIILSG